MEMTKELEQPTNGLTDDELAVKIWARVVRRLFGEFTNEGQLLALFKNSPLYDDIRATINREQFDFYTTGPFKATMACDVSMLKEGRPTNWLRVTKKDGLLELYKCSIVA